MRKPCDSHQWIRARLGFDIRIKLDSGLNGLLFLTCPNIFIGAVKQGFDVVPLIPLRYQLVCRGKDVNDLVIDKPAWSQKHTMINNYVINEMMLTKNI